MPQEKLPLERKLYQVIADRLREHIREGEFKAGARLPPERELVHILGVSRPSLREALIALEIDGSIEIKMGSGIYVCQKLLDAKSKMSTFGESPSALMQARAIIEGESIVMACMNGTKADYRYLKSCIDAMRACLAKGTHPVEEDRKFHHRLAKMSGNSALLKIIAALFDERHSPMSAHITEHAESSNTWVAAAVEHEAILRAVESKDLIGAKTAMRHHLKQSEERWLEGMDL
ncbi:FadR/GntR family transcriptional regulator [Pseudomonas asplenii]|uniref:FadR/GntR family transcriptional regulator n=1 Tax=Pseudomonas asplenii TaxID=53407 RepID=UPI0037CA4D2D